MRLPFLVLTPVCVYLGMATAVVQAEVILWGNLWLALVGALAAHIAVNTLNEYQDYHSGLDALTSRTPFSGGSGALIRWPDAAVAVGWAAWLALLCVGAIGLYFILLFGMAVLPLGALGVAIIVLYTRFINRRPWVCLLAPGFAFGPLMVVGTHFVLTGEYSRFAAGVSLVPFFLANNLLLLNQYPDVEADRQVGRCHLPIAYGLDFATGVYGFMTAAAMLVIVLSVDSGSLPSLCLLALLPGASGFMVWAGVRRFGNQLERLQPYLGLNVFAATVTPAVLAGALLLGR